ncbi:unnamed protein product, partial [Symbiodinium pilosum]
RGRPAEAERTPPAAEQTHWFERFQDSRRIGITSNRDTAASAEPAAGTSPPAQANPAERDERSEGTSQPPRAETVGKDDQDAGTAESSNAWLAQEEGGNGGFAAWQQADHGREESAAGMRYAAEEFHPGNDSWGGSGNGWTNGGKSWDQPDPAPGVWTTDSGSSASAARGAFQNQEPWESVDTWQAKDPAAEALEPWEEPKEPWDYPEPRENDKVSDGGGHLAAIHESPTPISSPPKHSQSVQSSPEAPASQGSPARPSNNGIQPSDEAAGSQWRAQEAQPEPFLSRTAGPPADAQELGGAPRTPVGPPAQCVKTFCGDANFLSTQQGDRVVLTHPEQNEMFCGHNLRTGQTNWLPSDVVGLPPEDRDPAVSSSSPPMPAQQASVPSQARPKPQPPVLHREPPGSPPEVVPNGHVPVVVKQPADLQAEASPVEVEPGMRVKNTRGMEGVVSDVYSRPGQIHVEFADGTRSWHCGIDRLQSLDGRPLKFAAAVLNGASAAASSHEVLNGTSSSPSLQEGELHDPAWETFVDPASNSFWYWHSTTKEWFFAQNPQLGWTRYQMEDGKVWWWNEDKQSWFWHAARKA